MGAIHSHIRRYTFYRLAFVGFPSPLSGRMGESNDGSVDGREQCKGEEVMRWHEPNHLEQRIVRKFLLLPMKIGRETRWLEWATVRQKYDWSNWMNVEFIDEEKK